MPHTRKARHGSKVLLMMMKMEDFIKEINNSLEEIQENTDKKLEALKEEKQKSLNELQENITKQVKELSKTIQDLKMEVEKNMISQRETHLEIELLAKKSGTTDVSIITRIQEIEQRISGAEDSIENMNTTIKVNAKCKKILTKNIQEIQDTMKRPNLRIIGIDENEDFQLKGPVNILNKIIEENIPNLRKEMPMNIEEAYRTPNRLDHKRNSSWHIIIRTTYALNKDRTLKVVREDGQVTYKGKLIRISPDFSPETMKARRPWTEVIQTLREHKCQPRLLYPDGETKVLHDKTKFTQYLSMNPALQRIIKGKLHHKEGNYALEEARKYSFNKPKRREPKEQNPNYNNKNNRK
jgi:hypothetical protein